MDPSALKDWQVGICDWYLSGGENPPIEKIQFVHLLQVLPEDLKGKLIRVGADPVIIDTMTFQTNVGRIVQDMLRRYPIDQLRATLFNGSIIHDKTMTGQEFLLQVAKRVHHCKMFDLTSEQLVILWSITNIRNPELREYLYKNMDALVTGNSFRKFLHTAEERHYALLANPDKGYTGLGTGKPVECARTTTNKNPRKEQNPRKEGKNNEDWKKAHACFRCAKDGHIDSQCPDTTIGQCSIGKCTKYHVPKAHTLMEEHIRKKEQRIEENRKQKKSGMQPPATAAVRETTVVHEAPAAPVAPAKPVQAPTNQEPPIQLSRTTVTGEGAAGMEREIQRLRIENEAFKKVNLLLLQLPQPFHQ